MIANVSGPMHTPTSKRQTTTKEEKKKKRGREGEEEKGKFLTRVAYLSSAAAVKSVYESSPEQLISTKPKMSLISAGLNCFDRLRISWKSSIEITPLCVLSACAHTRKKIS